ncbi:MAG TPA: DNA-3-methyladenine glycosylase [Candidatus Acidoferrum sp.]|jgi:DNA-3-methyladenine glycosylase II|nr:DNA-3-methyladenine glycosylase [Candidatus Acidoferrum sp.]
MTKDALEHLTSVDKTLARLIRKVGPCRLKTRARRSPFEALVQSVTYQQLNGTAAATILGRVKALYPHRRFPTPEDLLGTPDERLRAAGLSRAKTAALKDLAAKTIAGVVPTSRALSHMDDEEIVERLTTVRGVGPWTVEMLLIFTLGRPDVLPASDYGVRKGFALAYGRKELPTPKELSTFGQRWKPHRTTAAWYFWRALELGKANGTSDNTAWG